MNKENVANTRRLASELANEIKLLVKSTEDYDIARLLKKIEAEVMDIQHNLKLLIRITEGDTGAES